MAKSSKKKGQQQNASEIETIEEIHFISSSDCQNDRRSSRVHAVLRQCHQNILFL
jgi:hypothetical protein